MNPINDHSVKKLEPTNSPIPIKVKNEPNIIGFLVRLYNKLSDNFSVSNMIPSEKPVKKDGFTFRPRQSINFSKSRVKNFDFFLFQFENWISS